MESGERRVESGERRVENGERRVENGDTRQQDLSSLTPQASPLATDALPLVTPIAAEQASNAIASTESPASTSETGEEAPPADTHQAKGPGEPPLHVDNIVWAPNIIIPSSDEEGVRTFGLRFSSEVSDFRIRIYNRAGRQVYKSTDPHFQWDGAVGGTQMPQGAYVWVANFRDKEGNPHQENGTVTLVR